MNEFVVEVRHHPDARRTYCFSVPNGLAFQIVPGTRLEVDTCKGKSLAIAAGYAVHDPEKIREMMERIGAKEPLRPVTAVSAWANPKSIDVPASFLLSPPGKQKLRRREREYMTDGKFNTRIEVTHLWHTLQDGYSAYVVAKRLGLASVPVWIVEESEEGKEAYRRGID